MVWAMQHFNAYLYGHEVMVVTDHSAVKAILQTPNPSGKHARWWLKVFGSGVKMIDIVYRPGQENSKADALSRNPVPEAQIAQIHSSEAAKVNISQLLKMPPQTQVINNFHKEQLRDPKLQKILDYLNKGLLPDDSQEAKIATQASHFAIVQGVLYFINTSRPNLSKAALLPPEPLEPVDVYIRLPRITRFILVYRMALAEKNIKKARRYKAQYDKETRPLNH